jgi:hypothetical protein
VEAISTDAVVDHLVARWHSRIADFPSYLQAQFNFRLKRSPSFDRLVIFQMADGDMATRNLGRDALKKWEYEGDCLHSVPVNHTWQDMYKTDQADELYIAPVFLFFQYGHQLLLSERFGPSLFHRLLGDIRSEGNQLVVDWATIWCSTADRLPG